MFPHELPVLVQLIKVYVRLVLLPRQHVLSHCRFEFGQTSLLLDQIYMVTSATYHGLELKVVFS